MGKSREKTEAKSDRKFAKKVEFYAKVRDSVASLNVTKSITKKKKHRSRRNKSKASKAFDLSNLSEFLPELKAPREQAPAANFKLDSKSRKKLLVNEVQRLQLVLNHPSFQSDPLGAIHQHLESTQPPVDAPAKKTKKDGGKKVKRKKKSKSSAGIQPMDS